MPAAYSLELSEPTLSRCDCCNGSSVYLTRFVRRDGDAFAVSYTRYGNDHANNELVMLVSLGQWGQSGGDGNVPPDRVAFSCRVRPVDGSYEVMLADAADSPWSDVALIGKKLGRAEALAHPWKADVFEVLDHSFAHDPSLRGFLARVACGDVTVPLEHSFGMPDDVFALGPNREQRATLGRSFVVLDDRRFFVRCLLPIPVEGYGPWSVGVWIEVTQADHARIRDAWDDAETYPRLTFSGTIANDVGGQADLPVMLGTRVSLHVTDPDEPPKVFASEEPAVDVLVTDTWSRQAFEKYAVARGYL